MWGAAWGGVDGQYGLGRRTAGGMSMSTGDLAALYEAAQVHLLPPFVHVPMFAA